MLRRAIRTKNTSITSCWLLDMSYIICTSYIKFYCIKIVLQSLYVYQMKALNKQNKDLQCFWVCSWYFSTYGQKQNFIIFGLGKSQKVEYLWNLRSDFNKQGLKSKSIILTFWLKQKILKVKMQKSKIRSKTDFVTVTIEFHHKLNISGSTGPISTD